MKSYLSACLFILVFVPCLTGCTALFGMALPDGEEGERAEQLAHKIQDAVNIDAWNATNWIQWTLFGRSFIWDKKRHLIRAEWKNYQVYLNLDTNHGVAYKKGEKLSDTERDEILQKARSNFYNDSFWLIAPTKLFDDGTERRLVILDDEQEALLIRYTTGGDTPGDSYLWLVNENGLPYAYRMWVSIIPVDGMKAEWSDWQTTSTGVKIALHRKMGPKTFEVTNLRTGLTHTDLGLDNDIFEILEIFENFE